MKRVENYFQQGQLNLLARFVAVKLYLRMLLTRPRLAAGKLNRWLSELFALQDLWYFLFRLARGGVRAALRGFP